MKIKIILLIIVIPMIAKTQINDATFAILKLSYNVTGGTPVTGGICGSAFLINGNTLITAHHVLNKNTKPNNGFK